MTTAAEAKRMVVLGTIGSGVIAGVSTVSQTSTLPGTRLVVGVFVSGVMLAALAEVAPQLAAGLAGLMLVTSALVLGGPAWAGISAITTQKDPDQ